MKIAVIGGGWYGCHIALSLIELGLNVRVFEKQNELFHGASGNTIGRVHRGYHYPRSSKTIQEIQSSLEQFSSKYKNFIFETDQNLYGIPNNDSLIDWGCFTKTVTSNGLEIKDLNPNDFGLENMEGIGAVVESYLDNERAKCYFESNLSDVVTKNFTVSKDQVKQMKIGEEQFDWIINCTFNEIDLIDAKDTIFHDSYLFILKKIRATNWDSLTLMDGDFFSITPINNNFNSFYLYDVKSQRSFLNKNEDYRKLFEENVLSKITRYYPDFLSCFELHGFQKTRKTVSASLAAERTLKITKDNNTISVFPSKISSVCLAENYIKKIIFE